jgi:hypothetical protein
MKNNNEFIDLNINESSELIVLIFVDDECNVNIVERITKIDINKSFIFIEYNKIIINKNNYYFASGLDPPMPLRKLVA